jgi:hypothetical protein
MNDTIKSQYRGLTKGNRIALEALGREPLPQGTRATKAMRFTLPDELADRLEAMTKAERDRLIQNALS